MKKILSRLTERPVINGKQRHIKKEGLSIKAVAEATGKSLDTVLSMRF